MIQVDCKKHANDLVHLGLTSVLAVLITTGIALATDQQVSTPTNQAKPLTDALGVPDKLSILKPISSETFLDFARSVESDLESNRPMVAATMLDQLNEQVIMQSPQFDRYIGLLEKTSTALLRRGTSFPDNAALNKSISISTKLLILIDKKEQPGRLVAAQLNLGNTLSILGTRLGDHEMLDKGIATTRTTLGWRTMKRSPVNWAESQIALASALVASARISATNEKFTEAIEICDLVLAQTGSITIEAARTEALSVKANALWQFGQRQTDAAMILWAKESAQQALDATNQTVFPFEWATTLNYLANANREYSYWTADQKLLDLAISQYKESLGIRTREKFPLEWAQTQLDMGNALRRLSTQDGEELAASAYRHSLEVRTETDTPLEWGMSHNNLASSLTDKLKPSRNTVAREFDEALDSRRKSIKATTFERSPLSWALMQDNLGRTLIDIWDAKQRTLNDDIRKESSDAMLAQANYPMEKHEELHNLAMARILEHQNSVLELEEAIDSFDKALEVYTKIEHPWRWVDVNQYKAYAYQKIGMKQRNTNAIDKARKIFREQQTLFPREYDLARWVRLEINVGQTLSNIGAITNNPGKIREALFSYQQALEAIPKEQETWRGEVLDYIADETCTIGGMENDKAIVQKALDQYRALEQSNYQPKNLKNFNLEKRSDYFAFQLENCSNVIEMYKNAAALQGKPFPAK